MSAYIVSTDTIDLIVTAIGALQGEAKSSHLGLQEIGQILLDENVRSVNFRYDERTKNEPYTFLPVDLAMIPDWRVVAYKALRCWQYQACETDDFKSTTAYSIAEAAMGLLGVTDKHQAYEDAPWGWVRTIDEPEPEPEPAKADEPYKNTAEHAADIRKALKSQHGWTSRQVSVKTHNYSMGSSIHVTIKDANVPLAVVSAIARKAERIHRDGYGEILGGGNRFVDVSYDWDTLKQMGQKWLLAVEVAESDRRPGEDNALLSVAGTPFLVGKGSNGWGFSVWGEEGHILQCNDLEGVAQAIAVRMAGQTITGAVTNG